MTDAELTIEAERFDPAVRDGLAAFFRKALAPRPGGAVRQRRGDAAGLARRSSSGPSGGRSRPVGGDEVALQVEVDQADPETLVGDARPEHPRPNALDRAGVTTVRQFLGLPVGEVRFMRGVGNKTRDERSRSSTGCATFPRRGKPAGRRSGPGDGRGRGDARPRPRCAQRLIDPPAKAKATPIGHQDRADFLGLEAGRR